MSILNTNAVILTVEGPQVINCLIEDIKGSSPPDLKQIEERVDAIMKMVSMAPRNTFGKPLALLAEALNERKHDEIVKRINNAVESNLPIFFIRHCLPPYLSIGDTSRVYGKVNEAFASLARFDAVVKLINQHQPAIKDLGLCLKSFIHFLKSPMKAKLPGPVSGEEMKFPEHTWGMEMTYLNFNGFDKLLFTILPLCPNVRKLIYNSVPLPGESIKSLAQMKFPELRVLDLNFNLEEEQLLAIYKDLFTLFNKCPKLERVEFGGLPFHAFDDDLIGNFVKGFENQSHVTYLNLSQTAIKVRHLTTALRNLPNLSELYCDSINIGKDRDLDVVNKQFNDFVKTLGTRYHLKVLHIADRYSNSAHFAQVAEAVGNLYNLTSLVIRHIFVTNQDDACKVIALSESIKKLPLENFFIYGDLETAGDKPLLAFMSSLQAAAGTLKVLGIHVNLSAISAVRVFANTLSDLTKLTHLDINEIVLGCESIERVNPIATALTNCRDISTMCLGHLLLPICNETKTRAQQREVVLNDMRTLKGVLSNRRRITVLDLSVCHIGTKSGEGTYLLLETLKTLPFLRHLDLAETKIGYGGDAVIKAAGEVLGTLTYLEYLNLAFNNLGKAKKAILEEFVMNLAKLTKLGMLRIEGNDQDAFEELDEARERAENIRLGQEVEDVDVPDEPPGVVFSSDLSSVTHLNPAEYGYPQNVFSTLKLLLPKCKFSIESSSIENSED